MVGNIHLMARYLTLQIDISFTAHPHSCQEVLLDSMTLGPNIAKNAALQENVFVMAICIELRIPLFLVGKPGNSKSLAKSIVQSSMQGTASSSELLRGFKQASKMMKKTFGLTQAGCVSVEIAAKGLVNLLVTALPLSFPLPPPLSPPPPPPPPHTHTHTHTHTHSHAPPLLPPPPNPLPHRSTYFPTSAAISPPQRV